jgi:hypothetical protein
MKAVEMAHAEPYAAAVLSALDDPRNIINEKGDASRRSLAFEALEDFAARIGFLEKEPYESLRLWFSAKVLPSETRRPRVAVFGGGGPLTFEGLCYALGERLTAHGWHVGIGYADSIGPAIIAGYRRREHSALTLYTTSPQSRSADPAATKVFRSQQAMRRAMVAGADCCIVIAGSRNTLEECELAMSAGLPVLALTFTGGTARQVTEPTRRALAALKVPDSFLRLMDSAGHIEDAAERIVRVLNLVLRRSRKAAPSKARKGQRMKGAKKK